MNAGNNMRQKNVLSLDDAKLLLSAAEAEALSNKWQVVIAILDDGGNLVALHRMDGARPGNPEIAIQKARTSAMTERTSKVWEDWILEGRTSLLGVPVLPLQGGLPIIIDGQCIGAIGVSGVTSSQDEQIAYAAVKAVFDSAVFIRPGD
jgi:glc operon protein GlcG